MDPKLLIRRSDLEWQIPRTGRMQVPVILYANEALVRAMDDKVREQAINVASLPGIVQACHVMPDAHWGYGFPIGGVAAFDAERGGVVSAGGVGFDVSCGVRCLLTGLKRDDVMPVQQQLAEALFTQIPAGVGSRGAIHLNERQMHDMLTDGARWAVGQGWGTAADLERTEEQGQMLHAKPGNVSDQAKKRQRDEMGTLGSGNHYLEVQEVTAIHDASIAAAYGLEQGDIVVTIHCGSRGLGHQIGTDYLRLMVEAAPSYGLTLPDRELACAPLKSELGQQYLGAMRAAINCALANRQILTHLVRQVFARVCPTARMPLLYDVSHNTCKLEEHYVDGALRPLYVHRKGATRAWGPGHPELPEALRSAGQPVLIGGSMGTASYVLAGTRESESLAFSSACHAAGRAMSRHEALKHWQGRRVVDDLAAHGIVVRSPSPRGVAEEAPGAYKDVDEVVDVADRAGLARKVGAPRTADLREGVAHGHVQAAARRGRDDRPRHRPGDAAAGAAGAVRILRARRARLRAPGRAHERRDRATRAAGLPLGRRARNDRPLRARPAHRQPGDRDHDIGRAMARQGHPLPHEPRAPHLPEGGAPGRLRAREQPRARLVRRRIEGHARGAAGRRHRHRRRRSGCEPGLVPRRAAAAGRRTAAAVRVGGARQRRASGLGSDRAATRHRDAAAPGRGRRTGGARVRGASPA
jgi:tRNA-splicing ligase RtcB